MSDSPMKGQLCLLLMSGHQTFLSTISNRKYQLFLVFRVDTPIEGRLRPDGASVVGSILAKQEQMW
jgi:hypothetical protein